MKARFVTSLLAFVMLPGAVAAADRDALVRKDRVDLEDDPVWTYNDLDAGVAEAKRSGKPLLVVLRCIP